MSRLSLCATSALALLLSACAQSRIQQPAPPQPLFPDLYRSARAVDAALGVGVLYADYSTLVRRMSEELVLTGDRVRFDPSAGADARSKRVFENYGRLLELYKDAGRVWSLEIQDRKFASELPQLAKKYGVTGAIGGGEYIRTVDFESIRQTIWSKATALQEQQTADVFGRYAPPGGPK